MKRQTTLTLDSWTKLATAEVQRTMQALPALLRDRLREEAQDDTSVFQQELRTTLLHEIGHYLGLDEAALIARDLE